MKLMNPRLSHYAYWDLKLNIFRVLKTVPIPSIRTRFLRSYYGRLRRHTRVDLDGVFLKLPSNPVIVDLGANQDLFLPESLLRRTAEVHAVEPDPTIFQMLRERVGALKNVTLYNAAIGASDGFVTFYRQEQFDPRDPGRYSLGASIFASHQAVGRDAQIIVPQIGILTFLKQIGKHVDLMKIDIEGAEVPLLENSSFFSSGTKRICDSL